MRCVLCCQCVSVLVQLICVLALGAGAATGFGPLCLCEGLLSKCFGMAVGWVLSGYGCGSSTQYFFSHLKS